jgi:hypothetical protein
MNLPNGLGAGEYRAPPEDIFRRAEAAGEAVTVNASP